MPIATDDIKRGQIVYLTPHSGIVTGLTPHKGPYMTATDCATLIGADIETASFDRYDAPILSIGAQVHDLHLHDWTIHHTPTALYDEVTVAGDARLERRALAINGLNGNPSQGVAEVAALMGLQHLIATERARARARGSQVFVVSHWAQYDTVILDRACMRHGLPPLDTRGWECSKHAYATWLKAQGRPRDSAGLKHLAIESGFWTDEEEAAKHHDALEDARACAHGYAWVMRQLRLPAQQRDNTRDLLVQAQTTIADLRTQLAQVQDAPTDHIVRDDIAQGG